MKYREWLEIWIEKYVRHSVKLRTYERYKYIIEKHINNELGNYDLDNLTGIVLQDFILNKIEKGNIKTGKGLATSTVFGIFNVVSQSINEANNLSYTEVNNVRKVKMPMRFEKQINPFEKAEQQKIENYCLRWKSKPNHIGIIICLYTGIRIGELLALTYDDIDFDKQLLTINKTAYQIKKNGKTVQMIDRPKSRSSVRVIPLPYKIIRLLKRNKRRTNSPYIITTSKKGMVGIRSYQKTYELILNKLDIPYRNFHSLRHTFATRATEIGIDARSLSEILGHKNPLITLQRYTHSMLSYKKLYMNKLGNNLNLPTVNKFIMR